MGVNGTGLRHTSGTEAGSMKEHIRKITARAAAVHTRHREALEDAAELVAAPGVEVVVIRKPWPVGRRGVVWAVIRRGTGWYALVYLGERLATMPLSALARSPDAIDCERARIRHQAAWIQFQSGEFCD